MSVDTNKRSAWLKYAMCLGKSLCNHRFKTLSCDLFVFVVAVCCHDCFLFLRCKGSTEVLRIEETNAALADPKFKEHLGEFGNTLLPGSTAEYGKTMANETEKWAKVIKFSGAKPN